MFLEIKMPLTLETEVPYLVHHSSGRWLVTFKGFGVVHRMVKTHFGLPLWSQTFENPMEVVPDQQVEFRKYDGVGE